MPDPKGFDHKDGVTLKEYVDLRFDENQRAIEKAERAMGVRLEGMNEFRDTLRDQASRFLTRDEVRLMLNPLEDRACKNEEDIESLKLTRAELAGKATQGSVYLAYTISLIGIGIGLFGLLG